MTQGPEPLSKFLSPRRFSSYIQEQVSAAARWQRRTQPFLLHRTLIISLLIALIFSLISRNTAQAAFTGITATVSGQTTVTAYAGGELSVLVTVSRDNGTDYDTTSYRYGSDAFTCVNTPDNPNEVTDTDSETIVVPVPDTPGTYVLEVKGHAVLTPNALECPTGVNQESDVATITVNVFAAADNPDLVPSCGSDVILVLDESFSISESDAIDEVRTAAIAFLSGLNNTGSRVAIIEFNTQARQVFDYTEVNSLTLPDLENYVNDGAGAPQGGYDPTLGGQVGGFTNWDDAFAKVEERNDDSGVAPLVVFVTDGDPTTYGDGTVTESDPTYFADDPRVVEAIDGANAVKAQGSHILAIGVGAGLDNPESQGRLQQISGPDVYAGGALNLTTTDLILVSDFADLTTALQAIVTELCRSSVTITKLVDNTGAGTYVLGPGWEFSASTRYLQPNGTNFSWTLPDPSALPTDVVVETTDANGQLTYQWDPNGSSGSSTISITETVKPGFLLESATCQKTSGGGAITVTRSGNSFTVSNIAIDAIVTCEVRNKFIPPDIEVTKTANPTTVTENGADVTFTAVVKNIVPKPLTLVELLDALEGDSTADSSPIFDNTCIEGVETAPLAPTGQAGDSYTCTFKRFISGDESEFHHNRVTATAEDEQGNSVSKNDDATVDITDALPVIRVTKTANPTSVPEPGGSLVTFDVVVENLVNEVLTVTDIADALQPDSDATSGPITNNTCLAAPPVLLQPAGQAGDSYTCSFQRTVSGNAGLQHHNVVTATAEDDEGNEATDDDDATVDITDVLPVISVVKTANPTTVTEAGANVTFEVVVENLVNEVLTVTGIVDELLNDSTATSGPITNNTCLATPPVLLQPSGQAGDSYTCTFQRFISGDESEFHHNRVTATAEDDEGNEATDDDDSTVDITDALPVINVIKTANPTSVTEAGANVTFNVVVQNLVTEVLTVTDISDALEPDSSATSGAITNNTCLATPPVILQPAGQPGDTYTCTFQRFVSGNAAEQHHNRVTATAEDDEGNEATDNDDATVDITDVLPVINVIKSANPTSVPEPGGNLVTFDVVVENLVSEVLTVTQISDALLGDSDATSGPIVNNTCLAAPPVILQPVGQPGDSYTCTFQRTVSGNAGQQHHNRVTATAEDDEGNEATDNDDATVDITDVLPVISVIKTANPLTVTESGANVTFEVVVENQVNEVLTLTAISDELLGDSDANSGPITNNTCTAGLPAILQPAGQPGDSYTCTFRRFVSGDESQQHHNRVTGTAEDDEGNETTDDDDSTVDIVDALPVILVTKTANPTTVVEPGGGLVTFNVVVENQVTEVLTVTQISDELLADSSAASGPIVNNTCAAGLPAILQPAGQPGDSYTCSFQRTVSGDESEQHHNRVTGTAEDDEGNETTDDDDSTVDITDALPVINVIKTATPITVTESGGNVTFDVVVENQVSEVLTLTTISDELLADSSATSGPITNNTCPLGLPAILQPAGQPGDSYTCSFQRTVDGEAGDKHHNRVTATAVDDDDNSATDNDDSVVDVVDEVPEIEVTKTGNPTKIIGTSGPVTFTVIVENVGPVSVTLTSLTDSVFGNLDGKGTCRIGVTIDVGASYTCTFVETLTGNETLPHHNIITAVVRDEDGDEDDDDDDETVPFDEFPEIEVIKTGNPTQIEGSTGPVTFNVVVKNIGPVSVTLISLVDSVFGNLDGKGTCEIGGVIPVGGSYTCSFVETLTGSEALPHHDIITAVVRDKDGHEDDDDDDETVTFLDRPASIGDRVWFDTNGDGIQNPDELGAPGVTVTLFSATGLAVNSVDDANVVVSTVTDANGEYIFTGLEPGAYFIQFSRLTGYNFTRYDANGNKQDAADSDPLVPFVEVSVSDGDRLGEDRIAKLGEFLRYTIFFTNTDSIRQADNVVFTTTVPIGTSFVVSASAPGWNCTSPSAGGTCAYTLPALNPDVSGVVAFVVRLKEKDEDVPDQLDFAVGLINNTLPRTTNYTIIEGQVDRTVDAGFVRGSGIFEITETLFVPTNLPETEQPTQGILMYLPSVRTED